jgi:hypothetical protein
MEYHFTMLSLQERKSKQFMNGGIAKCFKFGGTRFNGLFTSSNNIQISCGSMSNIHFKCTENILMEIKSNHHIINVH